MMTPQINFPFPNHIPQPEPNLQSPYPYGLGVFPDVSRLPQGPYSPYPYPPQYPTSYNTLGYLGYPYPSLASLYGMNMSFDALYPAYGCSAVNTSKSIPPSNKGEAYENQYGNSPLNPQNGSSDFANGTSLSSLQGMAFDLLHPGYGCTPVEALKTSSPMSEEDDYGNKNVNPLLTSQNIGSDSTNGVSNYPTFGSHEISELNSQHLSLESSTGESNDATFGSFAMDLMKANPYSSEGTESD